MPLILIVLWIFGSSGADKVADELVYETESAYNYIQVLELSDYRYLCLNGGMGIHSIYHPTQLYYHGPWSQVLVAPFFNATPHPMESIDRMAIVGLAAGSTARQAEAVFEDIVIDGFEIDPYIVDVGYDYFGMEIDNLNVFVQDGRVGLKNSAGNYDIISIDAYRPPYIPWHLATVEFFEIVKNHLSDDGVVVINIGRSPSNRELLNDLSTTIHTIFPTVFVMDIPGSLNSVLFATKQAGSWENFVLNFEIISDLDVHPLLTEAMRVTIENRQETPPASRVYTDDQTPIEWVTNKMVVDIILSEELNFIR